MSPTEAELRSETDDLAVFAGLEHPELVEGDERLQREFSGKFVAFIDGWSTDGKQTLFRTILGHGDSLEEMEQDLSQHSGPDEERLRIQKVFVGVREDTSS